MTDQTTTVEATTTTPADTGILSGGEPAPAAAPAATSTTPSWREALPEDLRANPSLAQFNDMADLAKSYIHTKSQVGKKGTVLPNEKDTPEVWDNFYKTLGRPDLDKYEIQAKKEAGIAEDDVKAFKEAAHKAGLLPKQAQMILDWNTELSVQKNQLVQAATKQRQEQGVVELKKEWGAGWDKNVSAARMAVREIGGESFQKFLTETGLANDPTMIKAMANFGAKIFGEDKIVGNGAGKFGQTPAEIRAEINRITGDLKGPYWDSRHKSHRDVANQVAELYKKLDGG